MTKPSDIQKQQPVVEKSKDANPNILKQTADVNKDVANQQSNAATKITTEEVKDKQNIGNKYISNQILAEPIRVISPESIINAAIAAVNVLGQAIVNPIKEKLEVIEDLSQNPSAINNNQIKDCIDKTNKKCTTIAQTQAKTLELANGHIINGAFNTLINSGNSVHIVSDTATVNRSPFFSLSAQDTSIQSNNSINLVTDFNFNQFKQDVKFVEGTKISQAQTSLNVATSTNDNVAKVNRTVGIEENSSLGKVNKVMADNTLLAVSGDTAQIAAYGDMGMQSNGNIAILSTKPNTLSNIAASGEEDSGASESSPTSISIINSSSDYSDFLVMSDQGILSSSTKNQFTLSGGLNLTVGDKGAAMTSEKFTYFGNPKGGTFTIEGRSFLGKLSFPIIDFGQAELVDIPALPVLPSLKQKELENCLPSKFKEKNNFDPKTPDFNPQANSDSIEEFNILAEKYGKTPDFNPYANQAQVKPPEVPSANNKVELPRESEIFSNYNPTGEGMFTGKLPPPSVSSNITDNSSGIFVPSLTAAGVLPTKYVTDSEEVLFDLMSFEGFEFNTLYEALDNADFLEQAAFSLTDVESIFTTEYINEFTNSFLKETNTSSSIDFLSVLNYTQFYIKLFESNLDVLRKFEYTLEDFKDLDTNKIQAIFTLIQEYPQLKSKIIESVETAKLAPAIGFFGGLSKAFSFVSQNINVVKDFSKLPGLIQGGNFKEIFNFAKPFISKPLKGTVFGKLIENSDLMDTLLQFGTDITKGNLTKVARDKLLRDTFDKVYNTEIKKVLEKRVSDLLGPKLQDAIPLFKTIMCRVKLGCTIYPEDYIDEFSGILFKLTGDKNIQKANDIYQDLSQLIKDSKSGDVLKILTGDSLEGLLTTVLGANTAGNLSKVFNVVKSAVGLYDSVKLLPDLLNLMNKHNIPAIDQVGIALNCLDLFNKTKGLLDSIKGLGNGKNTAALLENTGRLAELKNTLDSLDNTTLKEVNDQLNQELDEEIDLVEYKRTLNSNLVLDTCFKLPKLNIFQSEIEVLELRPQSIVFKLTNFDILKSDIYLLPKRNDLVQLRVAGFYSLSSKEYLVPYQTDFQYTPSVYTFVISQYNTVSNVGVAFYDKSYSSIVLENEEGLLYKFNTEAIGNSLNLDIVDSYLLA
jgi:hypothetical protein